MASGTPPVVPLDFTNVLAKYQMLWYSKPPTTPEVVAIREADARFATAAFCARPLQRVALAAEWWSETYALIARFVDVCSLSVDESSALYSEAFRLRQLTQVFEK